MPYLIRYPDLIANPGRVVEDDVLSLDISATIMDVAGLGVPDHYHGHSLRSLLTNEGEIPRDDLFFEYFEDNTTGMGDHHKIRKEPHVYEALTHVPFIASWPGHFAKKSTNAMIANIDIFPTLFDLIDLELPPGVQGQSFASVLT